MGESLENILDLLVYSYIGSASKSYIHTHCCLHRSEMYHVYDAFLSSSSYLYQLACLCERVCQLHDSVTVEINLLVLQ